MWIEIKESESDKYLINMDKVCSIGKSNDGDQPGIEVYWEDGDSDHYDVSFEKMSKILLNIWWK